MVAFVVGWGVMGKTDIGLVVILLGRILVHGIIRG